MKSCDNCSTQVVKAFLCKSCYGYRWRAENKKKHREATQKWEKENKDRLTARKREYNLINKGMVDVYRLEWNRSNKDKVAARSKRWRIKYPEKEKARKGLSRTRLKNRTPKWLTEEQRNEIILMYKNCPKGYHVDHIIPLNGENISGLHVPSNLQYLPASENFSKSNKLEKKGG